MNINNEHRTTEELVDDAERLEEDGTYVEALGLWRTVIDRERDPVFLCQFGLLAMDLGMMKEARDAFLEAADLDPQLALVHDYLGMWYERQGNLHEAVRHFEVSLGIQQSEATYTLQGAVQLQLGQVEGARKSFHKALELNHHFEEAYYNLGLSYSHEELAKAGAFFSKALEVDPEYAKAHGELGWVLCRTHEVAEAEYHLRRAIELDETDAWPHIYLGNLLWKKHDLLPAEELFKKAIDLWPNTVCPVGAWQSFMSIKIEAKMLSVFISRLCPLMRSYLACYAPLLFLACYERHSPTPANKAQRRGKVVGRIRRRLTFLGNRRRNI